MDEEEGSVPDLFLRIERAQPLVTLLSALQGTATEQLACVTAETGGVWSREARSSIC